MDRDAAISPLKRPHWYSHGLNRLAYYFVDVWSPPHAGD
jgi:hypothetical protein